MQYGRDCPQCGAKCEESHKFCPQCAFPVAQLPPNSDDPLIGKSLPGGYVIHELVGIGGMGRVYRAEQTNLGRTVAVKIIHPHLVGEENAAARFITEARAASRLNHPNSVAVIDFGKTPDGQLYLVMEFLRGRDLARVMYEDGPLPFRRVINILTQVLAALSEAHHLDIIHRDLKPENVILEPLRTGGDFVKVVDFGLAKMRVDSEKKSITSPGIVCGTPEYMSPEQGRGDPLDARSDLYAVGVIFYQLLTGRLPFEAESPTQVVLMHLTQEPTDPRVAAPEREIPDALVEVCLMALAKKQDSRFSNADEFAEALQDAIGQMEVGRPTGPRPGPGVSKCPSCGASNPLAQKFCGECGSSMTTSPSKVVPPPSAGPADVDGAGRGLFLEGGRIRYPLPLMGREEDIAWLDERRSEATRSLTAALVVGDAGLGKSRLVREFLSIRAGEGDMVASTGPDPANAEVGLYAVRLAVRRLAGLPDDGGGPREWSSASPEARRGLTDIFQSETASKGRLSPEERRFAVAEALRWGIVRANELAKGRQVIVAVDDLHLVDGASRNAFADAMAEPPLVPALLVATHAPGFEPRWPEASVRVRHLMGLSSQVVTRLFLATGAPAATIGGSRGIAPLYLDQLLRFTREHGGGAPPRLADLIALRVERLPPQARRVLQIVSVFGEAGAASVEALLSEAGVLQSALAELRACAMLEEDGAGTLHTSHPLLREVVLATIPAAVRKSLHVAAAEACELSGSPIEVRALHEYHAQNTFQALILLEQVAARCSARGDSKGMVVALRRCLDLARRELFRGELDDPMRAVLIFSRKLGEALGLVGDFQDAEGVLREALDLAGPSGEERARVLGTLAHVALWRDRRTEAHSFLREALELAKKSGSVDLTASLEDLRREIAV